MPKKTAFFSTGAEAVENAIKIARAATGRSGVIAFAGGFHGRTMMGMALTGKVAPYKIGFGPFPGEVYHAPFPNALHGVTVEQSLQALHDLFKTSIEAKRVAAIILEPVQGEGGFYVAPPEFMQALRSLCDEHGIVLIADEIQSGFGRTGKLFAMQHYAVVPDLMTMAKSLAGGYPLSAVTGRAELMDAPAPGGLGGTYAGNPLAIAAAHAVLDLMQHDALPARGQTLGEQLVATLNELKPAVPQLAEVRGLGAMIAAEFLDPASGKPDAAFAKAVQTYALERGLILLSCGVYSNVLRFFVSADHRTKCIRRRSGYFEPGTAKRSVLRLIPDRIRSNAMQLKDPSLLRQQCYVNGAWIDADNHETVPVTNPATGEIIAHIPKLGQAETRRAIEAAQAAWPAWRSKTAKERAQILRKWNDLMLAHVDDLH